MLVIRAVTELYPDTVLLDGNRGRGYESLLRVRHLKAVFVHRPDDGQAGSYRFVRRVSIDKRACATELSTFIDWPETGSREISSKRTSGPE